MSRGSRPSLPWIGFVGASGVVAAGLTNLTTQYFMDYLLPALSLTETVETPGIMDAWEVMRAANPPLGLSMEQLPLWLGASAGVAIVINAATKRSESDVLTDADTIHGSARWMTDDEMRGYAHLKPTIKVDAPRSSLRGRLGMRVRQPWPKPDWCDDIEDDNFILSERGRITISKCPDYTHERNKHLFVMAGSGAGKTFNFVTTNILQLGSSMVFTDPKGEILANSGKFLAEHGYKVKVINIKDEESFEDSNRYNPFHYARNETDLANIIELLIKNTSGDSSSPSANQDFFVKAERQLYQALAGYMFNLYHDVDESYCNLPTLIDLLTMTKQEQGMSKSELDVLFFGTMKDDGHCGYRERLILKYGSEHRARQSREWGAITSYEGFCSTKGSPETIASIIASCFVRLQPFTIKSVRDMFLTDDLELEKVGTEKTALFIVTSSGEKTYDFIAAMLMYQFFSVSKRVAESSPGRHLPIPVVCYLDEVANIGNIPNLASQVAFLRSYWVNLAIIVQSEVDLTRAYTKEETESIRNNCDVTVWLGRTGYESCEKLSKEIGDTTKAYTSRSISDSASGRSVSTSTQYSKEPLISADEIYNGLDGNTCLVHIKADHWYRDRKADPREHRRWREFQRAGQFDMTEWAEQRKMEALVKTQDVEELPNGDLVVTY